MTLVRSCRVIELVWAQLKQSKEDPVMAKVFGIHMIGLRPNVTAEDFERFVVEEIPPTGLFPGVQQHLLKGDRGDREGKYLLLFEFESVEARDRLFPAPDQVSEEAQRHIDSMQTLWERWATFAPLPGAPTIYTDYVAVEK
jgi:hypothetical protein